MAISNRIAATVALCCSAWSLAYVVYSSSPRGHAWYSSLAKRWFDDYKGGVPIITLALPLLIMGSFSAICVVGRPSSAAASAAASYQHYIYAPRCWPLAIPCMLHRRIKRVLSRSNFDMVSFIFVVIPCLIYFVSGIYRHLYGHDLSREKQIKEVSNAGGQMAMIALSFFLVPVARHSVLLDLMGWQQEKAIRIHIWSGRMCILGVSFHGLGHMLRWYVINEKVIYMLLPETGCWRYHNEEYETTKCTSCNCYDLFRNFTGLVAFVSLLVIGFSSLCYIRRARYKTFYTLHLILGPASLLFSILHWNRMVLFICPSMLYYVATTVPVLVRLFRSRTNENGIKIVSATELSNPTSTGFTRMRSCVCLTFEVDDEAARQFSAGKYLKLSVPAISRISHPFTVNKGVGTKGRNQMQIIFRVTGPFTRALADMLLTPRQTNSSKGSTILAPLAVMDGFYGQKNLAEKVCSHDVAVIVAGGVGITPYLSLLSELCSIRQRTAEASLGDIQQIREIQFHWICRDEALMDYVKREFILPAFHAGTGGSTAPTIRFVIHSTSRDTADDAAVRRYSGTECTDDEFCLDDPRTLTLASGGLPYSPSRFAVASTTTMRGNLPIFLTFASMAWAGLAVVWFMYNRYASKSEILSRSYGILAVIPISLIVGAVANIAIEKFDAENSLTSWNIARKHAYIGLGGGNKGGSSDDQYGHEMVTHESSEAGLSLPEMSIGREQPSKLANGDTELQAKVPENNGLDAFSIEHSYGRPSLLSILSCLDAAHSPGVFVCGPTTMVKDVKSTSR
mmetsp:Transcript_33416/g.67439  ORF Transcript_33416/g.67439 Transcript_33416/m.67439 type:complete len:793 (-) Transcript_33416:247-2625(-)